MPSRSRRSRGLRSHRCSARRSGMGNPKNRRASMVAAPLAFPPGRRARGRASFGSSSLLGNCYRPRRPADTTFVPRGCAFREAPRSGPPAKSRHRSSPACTGRPSRGRRGWRRIRPTRWGRTARWPRTSREHSSRIACRCRRRHSRRLRARAQTPRGPASPSPRSPPRTASPCIYRAENRYARGTFRSTGWNRRRNSIENA
jgi:hypothetical protein